MRATTCVCGSNRSADRGARKLGEGSAGLCRSLVGSSWYDSPAIRPSSLNGRVAVFFATVAAHVICRRVVLMELRLLQPLTGG